eukprot:g4167.t1
MEREDVVEAKLNEVSKSRHIPDAVRFMLWGRAAGRCQFNGCNKPLWKNPVTQEAVNIAEAAHIYSFSKGGPRGNKGIVVNELNEFENLLLACHDCHKTIDTHQGAGGRYSVELLQGWKSAHEARVERVTGIDPDKASHVVLYGRAINGAHSPLRYDRSATAMFPQRYPAKDGAVELSISGSDSTERDAEFWNFEAKDLERKFGRTVLDRIASGEVGHMSVFGLAPMPLLIRLGTLLTDIRDVEVYQFHREPKGWKWPASGKTIELQVEKPESFGGAPALVVALSATVEDSRIHEALGKNVAIWRVTISEPTQECIRSKEDLAAFCEVMRPLLNEIKTAHGQASVLSIFPAAPVSTMVELGRIRQPKADQAWMIYDENRELGGFQEALRIGTEQGSFRLGTVIRPLAAGEGYDLDLVCRVQLDRTKYSQKDLKELVGAEVISYSRKQGFSEPPSEGRRCWTQQYQDEVDFHMDILPSILAGERYRSRLAEAGVEERLRAEAINITDRTNADYSHISLTWPRSNPRGYAVWFEMRMDVGGMAALARRGVLGNAGVVYASADSVPAYELKTPLQRAVQLLKRHRDQMFRNDPAGKPISIILTTLAARAYAGESDLAEALSGILERMGDYVLDQKPRIQNPVHPDEDFADRWTTQLEANFWRWLRQAQEDFAFIGGVTSPSGLGKAARDIFDLSLSQEAASAPFAGVVAAPAIVGLTKVASSAPPSWGQL